MSDRQIGVGGDEGRVQGYRSLEQPYDRRIPAGLPDPSSPTLEFREERIVRLGIGRGASSRRRSAVVNAISSALATVLASLVCSANIPAARCRTQPPRAACRRTPEASVGLTRTRPSLPSAPTTPSLEGRTEPRARGRSAPGSCWSLCIVGCFVPRSRRDCERRLASGRSTRSARRRSSHQRPDLDFRRAGSPSIFRPVTASGSAAVGPCRLHAVKPRPASRATTARPPPD